MSKRPGSDPAAAGVMLVVTILLCAAIGLGVGALAGFAVPLGIAGLFVGGVAGFAVVYSRFKNI